MPKVKISTSCNCSKPLLTSCIPYLKFDPFAIKFYGPYLEINFAKQS